MILNVFCRENTFSHIIFLQFYEFFFFYINIYLFYIAEAAADGGISPKPSLTNAALKPSKPYSKNTVRYLRAGSGPQYKVSSRYKAKLIGDEVKDDGLPLSATVQMSRPPSQLGVAVNQQVNVKGLLTEYDYIT